ncbi:hypothetical protein E4U53_005841 [Claviceps sorghi]|nr:hypothetical protein E4U53_005841 [Claviceps sorghi]
MHFSTSGILAAVALYAAQTAAYCNNDRGTVEIRTPCGASGNGWVCDTSGGGTVRRMGDGIYVAASAAQSITIKAVCSHHQSKSLIVHCSPLDASYFMFECPAGDEILVYSPAAN